MNLEDNLREALQRQSPPDGFGQRVAGRVLQARQDPPRRRSRLLWQAVSVAAAAALVLSISVQYRNLQEERAARQTIQALQIASEELYIVRDKVLNQ
jgi:hypothetical protein